MYVHPRAPQVAYAAAEVKYVKAIPLRLGVKLAVLCHAESVSYCYVYRPSSRWEAESHLMPYGLKLSVLTPPPEGIIVTDETRWEKFRRDKDVRHQRALFG
jgi:hypothetical protein